MPWPAPASLKVTNTAVAGAPTGNAPAMRSRASVRRAARSPMGGAVHSEARGRRLWPVALHIPIRFHDLRHTFATELLRRGVDSYRVQRLLRHSDVRVTTGTYAHLLVEDLRAAVDAHAPVPLAAPPTRDPKGAEDVNRPSAAAFLLHDAGSANEATIKAPQNPSESGADDGGRCRIRTCDPCRVKLVKVVGKPTSW